MVQYKGLFAVMVLCLSLAACCCSLPTFTGDVTPAAPTEEAGGNATPTPLSGGPIDDDTLLVDLYQRASPGVVNIDVAAGAGDELDAFGSGSGFLIDDEGHIVTNNHVIEAADAIYVTFNDGSIRQATVLGRDADSDLAVLHVDDVPADAAPLELGDSGGLSVGQRVVAIGNPFGLQGTMTMGIISGLGRSLPGRVAAGGGVFSNPEIIQTDAPINPGNSGGPLLDYYGRVIGVNTAIRTTGTGNMGIGFAVPVNTVKLIVPHLIAEGEYRYPYLGIYSENRFTIAQLAYELDLPTSHGVLVSSVTPGGPAALAGVRGGTRTATVLGETVQVGGDIIVAIDGDQVADFYGLIAYLIRETQVGQTVVLTVLRNGEELQIPVELGERPR
ncbi:MAG: trypsin-like peptidase domain-containing protein [Anaerolineae bacterium]|nr:trypsin-like peptidase domain-containing protein [Anaerolineae bacterium]